MKLGTFIHWKYYLFFYHKTAALIKLPYLHSQNADLIPSGVGLTWERAQGATFGKILFFDEMTPAYQMPTPERDLLNMVKPFAIEVS